MNDTMTAHPWLYLCPRHSRPTSLRCRRCDTPICYHCAIHNPVGYICHDCKRALLARYRTRIAWQGAR